MKHILRIDSGSTHCYWVRLPRFLSGRRHKSFADKKNGGKKKALKAAKLWRDKQLKILKPEIDKHVAKKNGQRYWGKGWHEEWSRRGDYEYLLIVAHVWDKKERAPIRKSFSVLQRGYDEAVKLAEQWRKLKLTGEL